ncbi:c-type cytochrome [Azoarcus indigens]|nr:c-type cytochrome [Azoarcus indigens]
MPERKERAATSEPAVFFARLRGESRQAKQGFARWSPPWHADRRAGARSDGAHLTADAPPRRSLSPAFPREEGGSTASTAARTTGPDSFPTGQNDTNNNRTQASGAQATLANAANAQAPKAAANHRRPFRTLLRTATLSALPLLALAAGANLDKRPGGDFTTDDQGREAYTRIAWEQVPAAQREAIANGRGLVRQTWVISPSVDPSIAGLGPTYNRPSCLSCHARNGRGEPPASADEPMRSMLVRLSIPGLDTHGGPRPEPVYGEQLNEIGVPGVPGEGEAYLQWQTQVERLADGTEVELRRPTVAFRKLAFGPLHADTLSSPRVAPAIFGLGLLEAVPEADILAIAEEQRREGRGVAGMPNRVWDVAQGRTVLGRFGWKANQPDLRQQVAGALAGDMGITSALFPEPNCPPAQSACAAWGADRHPELSAEALQDMTLYHYALMVPARRRTEAPEVQRGEQLFAAAGCASCHRPALRTGPFPPFPALAGQTIRPYTDLLLHDMGDGLADGRPDYLASGRQWRTPPLWGLGLLPVASEHGTLLHDGRARSPLEAILWHGGEASASREAVRAMAKAEREALLAFLASL